MTLHFNEANKKLHELELRTGRIAFSFDLPAGHSCPFAKDCKSMAVNGKIVDGPRSKFRCYAAMAEALYPHCNKNRAENLSTLKRLHTIDKIVQSIEDSLPIKQGIIRIHSSGDFFSYGYFQAWIIIALRHPTIKFYAYTKAIRWWLKLYQIIPKNMYLVASMGGTQDRLARRNNLPLVEVVKDRQEAKQKGLKISTSDIDCLRRKSFAILIHGVQPKGKNTVYRGQNYAEWQNNKV